MIKGLILYDYDGTLVDERDQIYVPTKKVKQTIAKLQDEGYLCMLATGRALSYIPNGAKDLHLDGYVTSNGAHVSVHGKEIFHNVFSSDELQSLLLLCKQYAINFILETKAFCYVGDLHEKSYLHFIDNFKIPQDNYVAYRSFENVKHHVEKITLAFPDQISLQKMAAIVAPTYQCSFHRNCTTFDIGIKDINKGVGVQKVMEHYNIPFDKTYAFGDGDNDVELLRSVKYGIAMRIHDPLLDEVAYMVTGSVKEEGIYEALRKLEVI